MAPWLKSHPIWGISIQLQIACQIDFAQMAVKIPKNTFNHTYKLVDRIGDANFADDQMQKSNALMFKMNAFNMQSIRPQAHCVSAA
jgi:ribosome maturation protein Sdo1